MTHEEYMKKATELTAALTFEEKLGLLSTHQQPVERLGLREFFIGTEVARGYVGREKERPSTVFPQPEGLAATFDAELLEQLGRIAGLEARAYYEQEKRGGLCLWGPTVDMVRHPLWGRTEEAYGEDVCLAGALTAAYTKGMAGEKDGQYLTVPTLKHFCANNNEEERGRCDAYLPLRLKYEYYYAAFEYGIRFGGARSVMAAYNEINGIPAIMNPELESVLKEQWGLWFAVSDGGDLSQNVTYHRFCTDMSEALALSLKAGCNIMTDGDQLTHAAAKAAVEKGLLTDQDIDRSVAQVLYARLRLGEIDSGEKRIPPDPSVIACEEHRRLNRRAAEEQFVLLKNNGMLPLSGDIKRLAVLGPLADENLMDWYTGYSPYETTVLSGIRERYPAAEIVHDTLWDIVAVKAPNGLYLTARSDGTVLADSSTVSDEQLFELQDWGEGWVDLFSVRHRRYLRLHDDGTVKLHNRKVYDWFTRETFNLFPTDRGVIIEEFLDHRRLTCADDGSIKAARSRGFVPDSLFEIELRSSGRERASALSASSDAVIYCTGNHPVQVAKECYDRRTLALDIQPAMTAHLKETSEKLLLLIISSYPYSVCTESEAADAVIWSSHAGPELGSAAAAVISGDVSPSGRLPLTWYRSERDIPDIMEYDIERGGMTYLYFKGEPLYPFGFGLSYCDFEYGDLSLSLSDGQITAELTVTNTSDRDGSEVVELYFSLPGSVLSRPEKKLCAFARVNIPAGETKTVTLRPSMHLFETYDVRSGKMFTEEGDYLFSAGSSSQDIRVKASLFIPGTKPSLRPRSFSADSFESSSCVRIKYSPALNRSYVRCTGYSGSITFGGLDLDGAKELIIRASSLLGIAPMTVTIGEEKQELSLSVSDSYDDFSEYALPIPSQPADSLTIELKQDCSVLDISVR